MEGAGDFLALLGIGPNAGLSAAGGAPTAAHADAAASVQAAAQRAQAVAMAQHGTDVHMLDELLPLEDLHDPFLQLPELATGGGGMHMAAHTLHAGAKPGAAADPLVAAHGLFSPTGAGFFGIPAYAEPSSARAVHAAMLNNAAGGPGLAAAVFGAAQQHASALPSAIAAAQQMAEQQALQMGMQAVAAAQQQPDTSASVGHGRSVSHGSAGSQLGSGGGSAGAAHAQLPVLSAGMSAGLASHGPQAEDSTGSGSLLDDQLEDAAGPAAGGFNSGGGAMTFTAGSGEPRAPAKRGGRPREKKSYDSLVDPSLPPDEIRRLRRMLSNRESARRSRSRRQCQLSSLEVELEALRSEREGLQSRLSQASSVVQQMAAEKAAMLAEIERLRCQLTAVSTSGAPAPAAAPLGAAAPGAPGAAASLGGVLGEGGSGAGRLPPLIEQAQRMAAAKLAQPLHACEDVLAN